MIKRRICLILPLVAIFVFLVAIFCALYAPKSYNINYDITITEVFKAQDGGVFDVNWRAQYQGNKSLSVFTFKGEQLISNNTIILSQQTADIDVYWQSFKKKVVKNDNGYKLTFYANSNNKATYAITCADDKPFAYFLEVFNDGQLIASHEIIGEDASYPEILEYVGVKDKAFILIANDYYIINQNGSLKKIDAPKNLYRYDFCIIDEKIYGLKKMSETKMSAIAIISGKVQHELEIELKSKVMGDNLKPPKFEVNYD